MDGLTGISWIEDKIFEQFDKYAFKKQEFNNTNTVHPVWYSCKFKNNVHQTSPQKIISFKKFEITIMILGQFSKSPNDKMLLHSSLGERPLINTA